MKLLAGIGFGMAALCFLGAWRRDCDQTWVFAGVVFFILSRLVFEFAIHGP